MRPYRGWKIGQLEREFDENLFNLEKCEYLARELRLRRQSSRVRALRDRVIQRISVGNKHVVPELVLQSATDADTRYARVLRWWRKVFGSR